MEEQQGTFFYCNKHTIIDLKGEKMDLRSGLLLVSCVFGLTCAIPVKFTDCGSSAGKVSTVDISPCSSLPCPLHKGQSYTVNVTYSSASQSSKDIVHGIIPIDDGCKSGIQCPMKSQETYYYVATLPVKKTYPAMWLVMLEWEHSDDMFCIKFHINIVS